MASTIREVVYSIRHYGCPVSDASAAVPDVRVSTVSKIQKEDARLRSLLHLEGADDDVEAYIEYLEGHDVPTNVRPFSTPAGKAGTYIVLTVAYDESLPSISETFSRHDCFQPTSIVVQRGYENWMVYHEASVDVASVADQLEEQGVSFSVQRNVGAKALPDARLGLSGNETQGLTDRQFEVLMAARRLGYYDADESVTMSDVGEELNLSSATVCEHLNNAENHVIKSVVDAVHPRDANVSARPPRKVPGDSP